MQNQIVPYSAIIGLPNGMECRVSYWFHSWLSKWNWYAIKDKNKYYVCTTFRSKGKVFSIKIHRVILGLSNPKILIDHIDGNALNNCHNNLRQCTAAQNNMNRNRHGKSGCKGVFITKSKGFLYYSPRVRANGITYYLGNFPYTEIGKIMAAKAYDNKARELHGEFANVNFY